MLKNKKSATSISVVLLVAMTLLLAASAIFVFLISSNPNEIINDARAIEEVYAKEEGFKFFIKQVALDVLNSKAANSDEFKAKFKSKIQDYLPNPQDEAALFSFIKFMQQNEWGADIYDNRVLIKVPNFRIVYSKTEKGFEWLMQPGKSKILFEYKTELVVEVERKVFK